MVHGEAERNDMVECLKESCPGIYNIHSPNIPEVDRLV